MQTNLKWEKNILSNLDDKIYSNNQLIGLLRNSVFSQKTHGELNGKRYIFQTKGFLNQHTDIIDSLENRVVGEITYNSWMTKASISINDKQFNWRYSNLWNSKWSISNSEEVSINYSGRSISGQIDSNTSNALLLLTGLFIFNYYSQTTICILFVLLLLYCS